LRRPADVLKDHKAANSAMPMRYDRRMSRSVALVVFPRFELLDLSGPLCAFTAATLHGYPYSVSVVSAQGGSISSGSGVSIDTTKPSPRRRYDTLMVVGGLTAHELPPGSDTVMLVRKLAAGARRVTSVCTGAFLLASADCLEGRRATTHWRYAGVLQSRFPKTRVDADRIFVKDASVWTSAGVTAGIDLALALIEEDYGTPLAKKIARDLVVHHRRHGGQSQFSTLLELEPTSGRVRQALAFARDHLHEPLSVERLAAAACMSSRHFGRLFLSETGETPARAIERLRIEAARPRVEESREPLESIARKVGFGDVERMRRSFVRLFDQTPQTLRRLARKAQLTSDQA
jgi:transcriptional regulator GlxA family with amidase domain